MMRRMKTTQNYAIVIGGWHFNALGVVRSLGEAGIPSVFVSTTDFACAGDSRYTLKTYYIKQTSDVVPCIQSIVKEFGGRPALFPTADPVALELDAQYDKLKDITFCPGCNGNIQKYMDKDVMSALAEEAGFFVPKTQTIDMAESGDEAIRAFGVPCILKPLSGLEGAKNDIRICTTTDELETAILELKRYKRILVQTYVHGQNNLMVEYCGSKTQGKPVEVYGQLEKIREYPVDRGSTSFAVVQPEITYIDEKALDSFLDAVGFSGVFDLELKVVDGKPYFIEINYRNGAIGYAFTKAGFNAPVTWMRHQQKEKAPENTARQTYLIAEGLDFSHVVDRNIGLFTYLKQFCKAKAHMIVNRKDMGPVFSFFKLLVPFVKARLHLA